MNNKFGKLYQLLFKNKLITAAGLFVAASMSANIINWLLNILAGRVLDTDEFAVYAVFVSIMGLLSVPANALATTVSRYYAYFSGKDSNSSIEALSRYYGKLALFLGFVAVAGVFVFNDALHSFFKLPSDRMVIFFAPVAFFLFTAAYFRGILKGKHQFGFVGLMLIIESLSKLILLFSGYVSNLPVLAIAIGSLPVSWFLSTLVGLLGNFRKTSTPIKQKIKSEFSKTESHLFMTNAFFASVGMMLLNSVDILLVKHFFPDAIAGTYALLTLFGKILYFGAGSFIELFVPITAKSFAKNSGSRVHFFRLLLIVSSIAVPVLSIFLLFPEFIVHLLLGDKGSVVLPYFTPYILATAFLLYTNCFNAFNTAKKHFLSTYLITVVAIVQGLLIYFFWHNSLDEVLNVVLVTQAALFLFVAFYEFFIYPKHNNSGNSNNRIGKLISSGFKNVFAKESVSNNFLPPLRIKEYKFLEEIQTPGLIKPHFIGIYKSQTGDKILAKIWHGQSKNFSYYSLKHEAKIFEIINAILSRNRSIFSAGMKNISIPGLVFTSESENEFILATKYVEGTLARNTDSKIQIKIYLKSVEFLRTVGKLATPEERRVIGNRSFGNYLLLFPALFAVSLLRQPDQILKLIKAALVFTENLSVMKKNQEFTLVHRDLHTHNIIIRGNKAWIIDLARCTFTYPVYEYVTTLPIEWNNKIFRKFLLKHIEEEISLYPEQKLLFKGLLANFVTHGLTANNLPILNIDRYKKVLYYITTGKIPDDIVKYTIR